MLYSGLYVNELISRVLEAGNQLFSNYSSIISTVFRLSRDATGSPEPALRRFELALLGILAMASISCIVQEAAKKSADTMTYRYREEKGFIASLVVDQYQFHRP